MAQVFYGAWCLIALSYTCSGVDKLSNPSWHGSALQRVFESPVARSGMLVGLLSSLPVFFLKGLTWGTLGLECYLLHSVW